MLFGNSGEMTGRLAIDGDGSLKWGDGGQNDTLDATLLRPIVAKVAWDPPPVAVGGATSLVVPMGSKPHCRGRGPCHNTGLLYYGQPEPGDIVSVGFTSVGAEDVQLSAQVRRT